MKYKLISLLSAFLFSIQAFAVADRLDCKIEFTPKGGKSKVVTEGTFDVVRVKTSEIQNPANPAESEVFTEGSATLTGALDNGGSLSMTVLINTAQLLDSTRHAQQSKQHIDFAGEISENGTGEAMTGSAPTPEAFGPSARGWDSINTLQGIALLNPQGFYPGTLIAQNGDVMAYSCTYISTFID